MEQEKNTTYRLIRTSLRRHIPISPQVNPQRLRSAHQPSAQVLSRDIRVAPLDGIAAECERAIGVLGGLEGYGEFLGVSFGGGLDIGVEEAI